MRCHWVTDNPIYIDYHDNEWGVPSHDDRYLFEMLVLESFQAGLSWECILNKRDAFREAFDNFDVKKVAKYDHDKVRELQENKGIVRNKLKIEAAIRNAQKFMEIQKMYGSFDKFIWSFTEGETIYGDGNTVSSPLSDEVSNTLKLWGMKFVGTTIIYSYLQAIGIIDDHEEICEKYYQR